jgi:hypothetical protein
MGMGMDPPGPIPVHPRQIGGGVGGGDPPGRQVGDEDGDGDRGFRALGPTWTRPLAPGKESAGFYYV